MAPAIIDYVVRSAGIAVPRANPTIPFRYIDLGCGYGVTLLCFAAAYPDAEFVGVDINAEHIKVARGLAKNAGLKNIEFICDGFEADTVCQLSPADYVTSHGVYSWVDETVQAQLLAAIDRLLKPDGAILISANTYAGWGDLPLVQRVFAEVRCSSPETDLPTLYQRALNQLETLAQISKNQQLREAVEQLDQIFSNNDENYVMHEFFSSAWRPIWTADLMRCCQPLGLAYCGRADLRLFRDDLVYTAEQRKTMDNALSPTEAETFRDLFLGYAAHSQFVFSRSRVSTESPLVSQPECWFTIDVPRKDAVFEVRTRAGRVVFDTPLCRRLLEQLALGSASYKTLIEVGQPNTAQEVTDTLDALMISQQIVPCDSPSQASVAVQALNDELARLDRLNPRQAAIGGTPLRV
ncbi:MAG: methyltransferase domain-containing protein [Granulosicoccus sp.]